MASITIPALLVLYAFVLVCLALNDVRRGKNYMIAQRRVGVFATMAAAAGNLRDGAGLAAWVILGIYYGFGALWLAFGLCGGLLVIAFLAPQARARAETNDYLTIQQLLRDNIGTRVGRLANWVVAATALLYAAAQVHIAGTLLSSAIGAPAWAGIAGTCIVVATYLLFGGYYTTIRTGIVQWCILMVILAIPWLIRSGGIHIPMATIGSPGVWTGAAFFAISFVVVVSSADLWQLVFSARSSKIARAGMLWTIPVYVAICVGLIYFAKSVEAALPAGTKPDVALFELFRSGVLPEPVVAVVALFVVAAIMSTLDSQVFLFVSTLVSALLPKETATDDERMRRMSRRVLLASFFILALIGIGIGNIVEFLFSAVTLATVLVPAIVLAVLRSRKVRPPDTVYDTGVGISIALATAVYVAMFATGMFKDLPFTLVPVAVSTAGCIAVSLCGKRFRRV